jgi:hypothetical protein
MKTIRYVCCTNEKKKERKEEFVYTVTHLPHPLHCLKLGTHIGLGGGGGGGRGGSGGGGFVVVNIMGIPWSGAGQPLGGSLSR